MVDMQCLMILRMPGLRTGERNFLFKKFENEGIPGNFSKNDIERIINRPLEGKPWKMESIRILAERDFNTAKRLDIKMVTLSDTNYPPLLREIDDPPVVLFCRGVLPDPEKPLVAMVGTRRPSSAAATAAYTMGRDFGSYGMPVVSGLALGIDACSHRGNTDAGAPAIAVLGSGLDQIYPASNRPLAARIIENGGALLSEYPPEMGPRKWHFPARNRIISAMARGTIIVEAPVKSGALITANCALEQGRDIWVTTAGTCSARGAGTVKLAADGAKVIDNAGEVLAEWGLSAVKNTFSGGKSEETQPEHLSDGSKQKNQTGNKLAASLARTLKIEMRD